MFERNLVRVTDARQLERSLNIGDEVGCRGPTCPSRMLTDEEFVEADLLAPKYASWWAFPVCEFTHRFSGNERAIFEEVKNDPSIRKIVLTRSNDIDIDGVMLRSCRLKVRRHSIA